jgi:putative CocE/NonD family hydrolase
MLDRTTPRPSAPEIVTQTLSCGATLMARVWRPASGGPHPVLLMRQPYGSEIASTVTLAHPSWYAAQGFITVVQDVRGAGASEGVWDTLAFEATDGAEACDWARALPGSNGRLGLYGFSYQGMTQMLALSGGGAADAIAPVMAPWDTRAQMATEGDAFRLSFNIGWAAQMAALQARRAGDGAAFAALRAAAMDPPVADAMPGKPEFSETCRSWCHLADWVERQDDAAFWDRRSPARLARTAPAALRTPALFVGGWFDPFLEGTIASFDAFRAAGAPARMVVGAWSHLVWGGRSVDTLLAEHFRAYLGGGACEGPAVEWQDVTRGEWRIFEAPPAERVQYALGGTGLAAAGSSGALVQGVGGDVSETFVHDPWRPVPARGLHLSASFGLVDRADLDARADVAVFTSEPLDAPLRLAGPASLRVAVEADAPNFDLHLVLSRVAPDGRVAALTSGYHRLTEMRETLSLRPICATLEPGERLRLSVAGACWPAFAVNPGTGDCPETTPAHLHRAITISLRGPAALSLTVAP